MKGASRGSPWVAHISRQKRAISVCEAKRAYATEEEAHAHSLLLPLSAREGLEVYACRSCGLYHTGHRRAG